MTAGTDKYRDMLINSILSASSQTEVKRFIDTAIQVMEKNKINKHLIVRFIGKVINDLSILNPMKKQAQQWDNIKVAKILLNRAWIQLNTPAD